MIWNIILSSTGYKKTMSLLFHSRVHKVFRAAQERLESPDNLWVSETIQENLQDYILCVYKTAFYSIFFFN